MFDIGFWEILVIGVIALLVIGPERLPSFIRSTADTIKSIKSVANGFKQEVSEQLKTHELHENLKKAEKLGMDNIGGDIKKSVDELKRAAESVQRPYKSENKTRTGEQAKDNAPDASPKVADEDDKK
nr:Sec-independent protein translocase protein TatB [Ningiella ruwaisensis]